MSQIRAVPIFPVTDTERRLSDLEKKYEALLKTLNALDRKLEAMGIPLYGQVQ